MKNGGQAQKSGKEKPKAAAQSQVKTAKEQGAEKHTMRLDDLENSPKKTKLQ